MCERWCVVNYEDAAELVSDPQTRVSASSAADVVIDTPLQVELYEVEADIAAEILIKEEEPIEKSPFRKKSVRFVGSLFALILPGTRHGIYDL